MERVICPFNQDQDCVSGCVFFDRNITALLPLVNFRAKLPRDIYDRQLKQALQRHAQAIQALIEARDLEIAFGRAHGYQSPEPLKCLLKEKS